MERNKFSIEKRWLKIIEKNNLTIARNASYAKNEKTYLAYISKQLKSWKTSHSLIIPNAEKLWHYLAVKKLWTLLRGITSKHYSNFYCMNYLHSFRTKGKLKSHNRACENKDFCNIIMPSEDTKY